MGYSSKNVQCGTVISKWQIRFSRGLCFINKVVLGGKQRSRFDRFYVFYDTSSANSKNFIDTTTCEKCPNSPWLVHFLPIVAFCLCRIPFPQFWDRNTFNVLPMDDAITSVEWLEERMTKRDSDHFVALFGTKSQHSRHTKNNFTINRVQY